MVKQPTHFETTCPKCQGLGSVCKNQDDIMWFDCFSCQYSASWHEVSGQNKEKLLADDGPSLDLITAEASTKGTKYCPLDHECINDCGECEMCPDYPDNTEDMNYECIAEKYFD